MLYIIISIFIINICTYKFLYVRKDHISYKSKVMMLNYFTFFQNASHIFYYRYFLINSIVIDLVWLWKIGMGLALFSVSRPPDSKNTNFAISYTVIYLTRGSGEYGILTLKVNIRVSIEPIGMKFTWNVKNIR